MLNIVGKCADRRSQLEGSLRDGFNVVEIQLLKDFKNRSVDEILRDIRQVNGIKVSSIHSPALEPQGVEIEDIVEYDRKLDVYKTFYIADRLGSEEGREIPVVLHMHSRMYDLDRKGDMLYSLVREVAICLDLFKHISICVENLIPVEVIGGKLITNNCYMFDNADLVKWLRKKLNTDRIYTVLDTCHLVTSIRVLEILKEDTGANIPSIEEFFENNKDVVKIIHLNNVVGLGLTPGKHSVGFEKDTNLLSKLAICINKYCNNADIVLEMNEEDYDKEPNRNKLDTLRLLEKLGIEYKIKEV